MSVSKFSRELGIGFYRQYAQMKTFIVGFLARLFPLDVICKFFYPVSLVFNS